MNIAKLKKVLEDGGVVMHPTETCYGLAVDVFNKRALEKLYRLKKMDKSKPVSILVDSLAMAEEFGVFSDKAFMLAKKYWPGPLSLIVPRKRSLPDFLNPGNEFVSIRFSADDFCRKMVSALGRPLTTTSANRTGEPQLYCADEDYFGGEVDLVVDGGEIRKNKPSTIVKVFGDELSIVRQGDLVLEGQV